MIKNDNFQILTKTHESMYFVNKDKRQFVQLDNGDLIRDLCMEKKKTNLTTVVCISCKRTRPKHVATTGSVSAFITRQNYPYHFNTIPVLPLRPIWPRFCLLAGGV